MPEIDFLEQGVVLLFSPIEAVGLSQIVMLQKGSDGHPAATLRHAFWPDRVPWGRSGEELTKKTRSIAGGSSLISLSRLSFSNGRLRKG